MNIALTYYCNQRCPYCFGQDAMSFNKGLSQAQEMSMASLNKLMEFMRRSRVNLFRMIGGEPTLHSHFEEIYAAIQEYGFRIMIFSNGLINKERVDFLAKKDSLKSILLNIREPSEYDKCDWQRIEYSLGRLHKKITLSFRIYRLNFDARFLFDLIEQYRLKRLINWAIACPSLGGQNVYLPLEDHKKAVEHMVHFSFESHRRKIRWYTDSGFIWCAFSDGRAQILSENVGFKPDTNCYPPIEVAPDLQVFRCYGLASKSSKNLKITDFKNLSEAEDYFFKKSLPFKRIGGLDKCFRCEHIISQRCGGGCLVHILKKFRNYKKMPAIF